MQLICDGRSSKVEVLDTTIEEYKEVFIKARRDFATVLDVSIGLVGADMKSVRNFMNGQGEAQEALRAAARGGRGTRGARGAARGTRGRGAAPRAPARRNNDESDEGSDDSDGPPRGGGAVRRGRPSTRARGASTRGRGRGGATETHPGRGSRNDGTFTAVALYGEGALLGLST